jgi:anti-anti-sigma factor
LVRDGELIAAPFSGAPQMFESKVEDEQGTPTQAPMSARRATVRLSVEGPMTFARAIELRDALLAPLVDRPSSIELDLSSTTELDSAGVQILLLLKMTANARDIELQLVGQSSAVLRTLELLRLDTHWAAPEFVLFGEDSP